MKKQLLWCMAALSFSAASAQTYETRFARPLSDVLNDVAARFQVRLKYDVDTVGRVLPYADFRIRPYSLEETLTNVLSPFDYKFVKQSDKVYKLKPYEYIIRKSKFPQNPKRSVRFSGKRTKRSVQKRKAHNTQKAETKVL